MAKITKEEILKLAKASHISVGDDIESFASRIDTLLQYVDILKEVTGGKTVPELPQNVNINRQDTVIKTDPEPILAQAPAREGNYFVVPVIIKS